MAAEKLNDPQKIILYHKIQNYLNAFGDNLSVGEIKFPAALLTTTLGTPNLFWHASRASLIANGSRTSHETGSTCPPVKLSISLAVSSRIGNLLKENGCYVKKDYLTDFLIRCHCLVRLKVVLLHNRETVTSNAIDIPSGMAMASFIVRSEVTVALYIENTKALKRYK